MDLPLIVNVDCAFARDPGYAYEQARFAAIPAELRLTPARTEDDIIEACHEADFLLAEYGNTPLTARVIAGLPRCRAIVKYGIGVDHIDIAAATAAGIVVCNAAAFCVEEVSDHTIALLLSSVRRIAVMDRNIRSGGWLDFPVSGPIRRLCTQTVGLIGFGRIAQAVARKLVAWGLPILAYDPLVPHVDGHPNVCRVELEPLLESSDIVSIHAPLMETTRGLLGETQIRLMKPSSLIINTSRGPVVQEPALVRALEEGWIAGAALDVYDEEPLRAGHPFLRMDNVILTPHYAGRSDDSIADLKQTVADSVEALSTGFWPPHPVNPDVMPRKPLQPWAEFEAQRSTVAVSQ